MKKVDEKVYTAEVTIQKYVYSSLNEFWEHEKVMIENGFKSYEQKIEDFKGIVKTLKTEIEKLKGEKTTMSRLQEILSTMGVPEGRKNDLGWLWRNLGVGTNNPNRTHPEYWDAMQLIKEEIKKKSNLS